MVFHLNAVKFSDSTDRDAKRMEFAVPDPRLTLRHCKPANVGQTCAHQPSMPHTSTPFLCGRDQEQIKNIPGPTYGLQ
jgi:hypothetical protein